MPVIFLTKLGLLISCGDGSLGGPPPRGDNYECHNMKLMLKQQQRVRFVFPISSCQFASAPDVEMIDKMERISGISCFRIQCCSSVTRYLKV